MPPAHGHWTTLCSLLFLPIRSSQYLSSTATPYFPAPMTLHFRGKYQLSSSVHEDAITCVAFSIKGEYVAAGGLRRRLQIFSLDDGKLHYLIALTSSIKSLTWLPGAEQTLLCACHSGILINIIIRPGVRDHIYPQ